MRPVAFLPVLLVIAIGVAMVAFDPGGASGVTTTVSAQAERPAMNLSHVEIPFFEDWVTSPHADLTSEAWIHWNEDDPAVVPASCAKCHSSGGYQDFIGLDGSEVGKVDEAQAPGVAQCSTCHNDVTLAKDSVVMPSGELLTGLGREAVCMECHQGRASGSRVASIIEEAAVEPDATIAEQGFINIHYYAAAATLYGSDAHAGYEYEGAWYEPRFEHVDGFNTCQSCHDPHTLEVEVAACATCHVDVETKDDLKEIRMPASFVDYDGDGSITTGIYTELYNLRHILFDTIQTYAREVVGEPIGYGDGHPYFFYDLDDDGEISSEEQVRANAYASFTPRLLAATYNYQVAKKDPGGYVHNAKYLMQIVHDSIADLTAAMDGDTMGLVRPGDIVAAVPVSDVLADASPDFASLRDALALTPVVDLGVIERLHRDDAGHFDGSAEAWRHWDEDGAVPASCSTCHSADGLPFFLQHGTQIAQATAAGMSCSTCHVDVENGDFSVPEVEAVTFPSGAELSFGNSGDNLCAVCHQGRASTPAVDRRIGSAGDDVVTEGLGFINVHYFSAAATRFGGEAAGGYQYAGKDYVGFWPHDSDVATCTQCHDPHNQQVDIAATCSDCHSDAATIADVRDFREFPGDFDGDGNDEAGTYYEMQGMIAMLNEAMQAYSREVIGTQVLYDSHSYPYFFVDTNQNGAADEGEVNYGNQYRSWTPRLLRAAYNYQYAQKDTGGYVHNSQYIIQLLHDSIEDMGMDVSDMYRPDQPF